MLCKNRTKVGGSLQIRVALTTYNRILHRCSVLSCIHSTCSIMYTPKLKWVISPNLYWAESNKVAGKTNLTSSSSSLRYLSRNSARVSKQEGHVCTFDFNPKKYISQNVLVSWRSGKPTPTQNKNIISRRNIKWKMIQWRIGIATIMTWEMQFIKLTEVQQYIPQGQRPISHWTASKASTTQ